MSEKETNSKLQWQWNEKPMASKHINGGHGGVMAAWSPSKSEAQRKESK